MERHRPPRLSLDLLRGFRAAARHLSFTRAARRAADRAAVAAFVAWLKEETRRDEERAPRAIGLAAGSARRGGS